MGSDGYLRELYQREGIAETVNFDHIKCHYYITHMEINPSGIAPLGPELDLDAQHGRDTHKVGRPGDDKKDTLAN